MYAGHKYICEYVDWFVAKRNAFFVVFVVSVVGFSSVIRANCPYRDDARTILRNYEEWEQSGRMVSHVLSELLFFGMQADISPFIQILALFILSLTAMMLLYYLNKDGNFFHLLCFFPICLSPYILENLSYKFGSLWMAFAFLILMAPFVVSRSTQDKNIVFLVTFLSVFLVFNIYQPCIGFFVSILAYRLLLNVRNNVSLRLGFKNELYLTCGAIVAAVAYFLEIKYLFPITSEWGKSHAAMLGGEEDILHLLVRNIKLYYDYIAFDWDRSVFKFVLILNLYVIIVLSFKKIFTKDNILTSLARCIVFLALLFFLLLAPFLIQLFLASPVLMPRTLLVVGASFSLLLFDAFSLIKEKKLYCKVFYGIIAYTALQLVVISSIYGNLLTSQMDWEHNRMFPLAYQLINVQRQTQCKSIYFENTVGYSPTMLNIVKKYPIMYKLINPSIGSHYFASEVLRGYGIQLEKTDTPPYGGNEKIYYDEPWYVISENRNVCILVFKED